MRKNTQAAYNLWESGGRSTASVRGTSIWTDGKIIYSYGTPLLMVAPGGDVLILNVTKYSVTTSQQQGGLGFLLRGYDVLEVSGIPQGATASKLLEAAMIAA